MSAIRRSVARLVVPVVEHVAVDLAVRAAEEEGLQPLLPLVQLVAPLHLAPPAAVLLAVVLWVLSLCCSG